MGPYRRAIEEAAHHNFVAYNEGNQKNSEADPPPAYITHMIKKLAKALYFS
jgi:hypothetical protein